MVQFLKWLLRMFFWFAPGRAPKEDSREVPTGIPREPPAQSPGEPPTERPVPSPAEDPAEPPTPLIKTIRTLLIFPSSTEEISLDRTTQLGDDNYYVSSPWNLELEKVNQAIRGGEDWLAEALGTRISWEPVRLINSQQPLSEWRSRSIGLLRGEVEQLGLPWTDDYIYLAFVRGMGGYAGGVAYQGGNAGYAMVGDICLEAICEYSEPTAGSVLLGVSGWPANSYSLIGQTGAFVHEALHGLDLPHPDCWPEGDQPDWDETLMGNWWNMPDFSNTKGLTQREIEKVLQWNPASQ